MSQDAPASASAGASARLQHALRRVLRPIVKLMLLQGIPFQHAAGLLRQVYFDVASTEIDLGGERPSDSRLAIVTGIHRKELRRLRERAQSDATPPHSVSLGAQLVAQWTSDERFLDADDRPLPLGRSTRAGSADDDSPTFDELVLSVSRDVHPRSVLDEWLRLGVVRVDDEKRIHLVTSAFVPRKGFEEKLFYFARNNHDHLEASLRNLQSDEPPLMERSVHYVDLAPEHVNMLSRFAEQEGMKLLESVNRLARESSNDGGSDKRERMNFGLYFYRGSDRNEDAADEEGHHE